MFKGPTIGQDLLTASVILAIMILPTILAISREIIAQVPRLQKEGMLALGATDWEMLRKAVLPYAWGGIIGAAMLGLARAIGETMAVTMVIGNSSQADFRLAVHAGLHHRQRDCQPVHRSRYADVFQRDCRTGVGSAAGLGTV